MQVLDPIDIEREKRGVEIDGIRWFPKAKPLKMLRIFRTRFDDLEHAKEEIERVKIVLKFLNPNQLALSDEFLVTYYWNGSSDQLLCGLQEYVKGEILDPWSPIDTNHLRELLTRLAPDQVNAREYTAEQLSESVRHRAAVFIENIKKMILGAKHIPDLAGVGNLLLTYEGNIKLVDINNISKVHFDSTIRIDDRGYPVCDKSIQALYLLEEKMLQTPIEKDTKIYKAYLDPSRIRDVKQVEREFHLSMGEVGYFSD
jgi:hypothetical protein